ncbi:hypothetical protein MCUN1_000788 [Malassezia cuniculi]|uniref:Very-long-chain 3-oxoacyl-CoA reductase n=1 Tax=Malassezia cuniculi TaxID=948313 RepID=A0AAF0J5E0_9BASI|nr:hypothetical protein MCUN1_000788 [Malassezia cuniculi]
MCHNLISQQQIEQVPQCVVLSFAAVGVVAVALVLFAVLRAVAEIHILPGRALSRYGANTRSRGAGSWALVTGATDGIGREFAMQLAARGFNVVLASRTLAKLEALAREIESKYVGTKTLVQAIDFSQPSEAQYGELARNTLHLDVAVLVNNVGRSHDMPVAFAESDVDEMEGIVNVNVLGTLRVTRIFAPRLAARRNGLILSIGSFSGQLATPLLATYAGSKAFLIGWSQALAEEMRRVNVDVAVLNTFFVVSNMSKLRRPTLMAPTPKQYVAAALSRLGRPGGAIGRVYTTTPCTT